MTSCQVSMGNVWASMITAAFGKACVKQQFSESMTSCQVSAHNICDSMIRAAVKEPCQEQQSHNCTTSFQVRTRVALPAALVGSAPSGNRQPCVWINSAW
jgi:hypothetical protein